METVLDSVVLQHILTLDITNINALMQVCKSFHRKITENVQVMKLAYDHYKAVIEDRVDAHIKRALDVNNDNKIISLISKSSAYDPSVSQSISLTFDTQAYAYPLTYTFSANPSQLSSLKQLVKLQRVHKQIQKYNTDASNPYEYDITDDLLDNFFDISEIKYKLHPELKPPKSFLAGYTLYDVLVWFMGILFVIILGVGLGRLLAFII